MRIGGEMTGAFTSSKITDEEGYMTSAASGGKAEVAEANQEIRESDRDLHTNPEEGKNAKNDGGNASKENRDVYSKDISGGALRIFGGAQGGRKNPPQEKERGRSGKETESEFSYRERVEKYKGGQEKTGGKAMEKRIVMKKRGVIKPVGGFLHKKRRSVLGKNAN